MKGDFTRVTFRPARHFSGVRQQQGRVQLDADWNEQVDIEAHRDVTTTADLVGDCGTPWTVDGFRIGVTPGETDLTIGPGRFYADGVLCEYEATPIAISPTPTVPTATLRVSTTIPDGVALEKDQWVEVAHAGSPPGATLLQVTSAPTNPTIDRREIVLAGAAPAAARTVRRIFTYQTQPDYPLPTPAPALANGNYLAYLDVWQLHLTALDRPAVREVALGGPDTTTRTKTVWQVKLTPIADEPCSTFRGDWVPPEAVSTGRLRARADEALTVTDECQVPPGAGYRRLENQLYRVEVHSIQSGGQITYKWSRDNGSVVASLTDTNPAASKVTVADPGKDSVLRFAKGQWIEIIDEERMLRGETGVLREVTGVDGTVLSVTPAPPARNAFSQNRVVTVRRWDKVETYAAGGWHPLEDGVSVQFEAGKQYQPGDYWTIPARTLTGTVEWPTDGAGPIYEPRHGTLHHYCPLARVKRAAGVWKVASDSDCRPCFPSLTEVTSLLYISGDGQEVMPDLTALAPALVRLEEPLVVAVTKGQWPVAGAKVRFEVLTGGPGQVQDVGGAMARARTTVVETALDGTARCFWWLDGTSYAPAGLVQQVSATLLTDTGIAAPNPSIVFGANLSVASQVAFNPGTCGSLAAPPAKTVQAAIERLAALTRLFYIGGDGQEARPGEWLPQRLEVGVASDCGATTGARVRFDSLDTAGQVAAAPTAGSQPSSLEVASVGGRASCVWKLNPDITKPSQQLEATLLDASGTALYPPVRFTANLSIASEVAIVPGCPKEASTVQQAINQLCELTQLFYIGGDGQTGSPGSPLPYDLEVGITNGDGLVRQDKGVTFTVEGGGTLQASGGTPVSGAVEIDPDGSGVYRCKWSLGGTGGQRVTATLTNPTRSVHLPIRFHADFGGAATEPGIRVEGVRFVSPNIPIGLGDQYPVHVIAKGIQVLCIPPEGLPGPSLAGQTISRATCFATVDVPLSMTAPAPHAPPHPANTGFLPTVLAMTPTLEGSDIVLRPSTEAVTYLGRTLESLTGTDEPRELLIRLKLLGNFLWGGDQPIYLDGDSFSRWPEDGNTPVLRLPSGDGRRGGNFEMWFWLVPKIGRPTIDPTIDVIRLLPEGGLLVKRVQFPEPLTKPIRVLLTSSREDVTVPNKIDVPAGATFFEVPVSANQGGRRGAVTVTLTPMKGEWEPVTISLKVQRG
jgi:hypothetical protein